MKASIRIFVLCIIPLSINCSSDYYWRDWNGTIPSDAFVSSTDGRGPVYVAQAYLYNNGLFIGEIYRTGQKYVIVNPKVDTWYSEQSSVAKVLCTTRNSFFWVSTNQTTTPTLLKYTIPVIGGITKNNETVYVGRSESRSYIYTGSVHTDYSLHYTDLSTFGAHSQSYELLVQGT